MSLMNMIMAVFYDSSVWKLNLLCLFTNADCISMKDLINEFNVNKRGVGKMNQNLSYYHFNCFFLACICQLVIVKYYLKRYIFL